MKNNYELDMECRERVSDRVWDQVSHQVRTQVFNQVVNQVTDQIWRQVRDQVYDRVSPLIWQETAKMRPGIFKFISDQVSDEVRDQVNRRIRDQVFNRVGSRVWRNIIFSPNKLVFIYSFLKGSFSPNSNIQILMCICTVQYLFMVEIISSICSTGTIKR
jgi:hypothetical protein